MLRFFHSFEGKSKTSLHKICWAEGSLCQFVSKLGFEILDWIYNLLKIWVCLSIEAKFLRVMAVAMKIGVEEEIFAAVIAALLDTFKKGENKGLLKRLGSGLNRLLPSVIDGIKRLDLPKKNTKRSTEDVKKGEKQVRKCSKSRRWRWSCCFKLCCPIELCESDEDIARSCEDDTEANSTRNHGSEISVNLNINIQEQEYRPRAFCAVRRPPDFTVGFDKPMTELKTLLLKEEVHQLLLTAPAGCGKTTLVQMLCQDKQIKGTPLSLSRY